jgi:hypothetical protein
LVADQRLGTFCEVLWSGESFALLDAAKQSFFSALEAIEQREHTRLMASYAALRKRYPELKSALGRHNLYQFGDRRRRRKQLNPAPNLTDFRLGVDGLNRNKRLQKLRLEVFLSIVSVAYSCPNCSRKFAQFNLTGLLLFCAAFPRA